MRVEQLEAWVLSLVDLVTKVRKVEDSRVELKADWPDSLSAARRIAAHANAADGSAVLWIIGLDEERGVTPLSNVDPATWVAQVAKEFDQLAPAFQDLVVPVESSSVVALLIDTTRRPFVVRNPTFGKQGGGSVALEVPWREGTAVRSARRQDLLRLLVPQQTLPSVELLSASVRASTSQKPQKGGAVEHWVTWLTVLQLYVIPMGNERVVFPRHKTRLAIAFDRSILRCEVGFQTPTYHLPDRLVRDSETVATTSGEAIVRGPGRLEVDGYFTHHYEDTLITGPLSVQLLLALAGSDHTIVLNAIVEEDVANSDTGSKTWSLSQS